MSNGDPSVHKTSEAGGNNLAAGQKGSRGLLSWLSQLARVAENITDPAGKAVLARMPTKLGSFRLQGLLGIGTFGVVFRAEDTVLGREIALKVAWPYVMYDPIASKRFVKEPEAAAALNHPGIVKVYKSGWVGSVCYIALELIDGPAMNEWLKAQTHVPPRLASQIMLEVAEAIQFVHDKGLIHRDIKPSNILFKPRSAAMQFEYAPVITDLGLARRLRMSAASAESATRAIVGTDYYMSPEQALGQKASERSDVFSLGVVLYELVCGRRPFEGESSEKVRQRIIYDDPPAIRGFQNRIPKDLAAIVLRCLEKSPGDRYPSAQALGNDLANFLGGKPVEARLPTAFERGCKLVKRNPSESALVAIAMASMILIAGLVGAWVVDRSFTAKQIAAAEAIERQHQYAANIQHAAEAQMHGGRREVLRLLDECRDLVPASGSPGIEWDLLWSQVNGADHTLDGHSKSVHSLRFTPQGDSLVSAGEDGRVIVWETAKWTKRIELNANIGEVNASEISTDGCLLAVGGDDGRVVVYQMRDGAVIFDEAVVEGRVFAIHWLGSRQQFAVGGGDAVLSIVDPVNHEWRKKGPLQASARRRGADPGHPVEIESLAYIPDGDLIAVAMAPGGLYLIDVPTLSEVHRFDSEAFAAYSICYVPVGPGYLAATSFSYLQLWRLDNGAKVTELQVESVPKCLCYSPADKSLVAGLRNGTVLNWNVESLLTQTKPIARRLLAHDDRTSTVAVSSDGAWLASGGRDTRIGLWRRKPIDRPFDVSLESKPHSIEFSPCGRWMAMIDGSALLRRRITMCDAATGDLLWTTGCPTADDTLVKEGEQRDYIGVAFHPQGAEVACLEGDHVVRIRDPSTGNVIRHYPLPKDEDIAILSYALNARALIVRSGTNGPFWLDQTAGNAKKHPRLTRWTIGVLHPAKGEVLLESKSGLQTFMRAMPEASSPVALSGLTDMVLRANVSPDGRCLVATGADSVVYTWNLDKLATAAKFVGHQGTVEKVQFSADGNTVLSNGQDGTVRFWHAPTRAELLKLGSEDQPIHCMGLNPAGNLLVLGVESEGCYGLQLHRLGPEHNALPQTFELSSLEKLGL